ncbi:Septal ring factor EnvC, activator of murein hydrolases AmiA and AmiB [Pseudomonas cuatrocienegasensis]|uniref:Septal ring factor EnvC, activator of murein hydrolases AmiA and AmiB n=1 Tax=Pseudomonas cuatrocienegasensis TaxID=543360 RepID=A0ABY1B674_9PSED|nr:MULTISPECIES: murein hydrolase activator EnvC [Pseudomonas]OEC36736.1 peptidase M23 [Pseudomonas sp. 21C1]SEQ05058.1 Septal ring factor EnvC, activator of murein hydrolases AmiA and AmiB [Pseudomonas cuatrocienegasensis]
MFRALLLICLTCLLTPAFADEKADAQKQLEAARSDVAELKKLLEQLQRDKSGVQSELKKTETEMGELQKQVDGLQRDLKSSEGEIQRLDKEKKQLEGARLEQQRLIGIQARAAYQSGRQEYVKLLLNQQNPERFARTLTYYDYISQARMEQLATFNETLRQLNNVEQDIVQQQAQLLEQKSALDSRRTQLAEVRKERQVALARLNKEFTERDRKLKARQEDQAQLAQVLKTIDETLARQAREAQAARARALADAREQEQRQARPSAPSSGPLVSAGASYGGPFAQARGKLPWPVDGRLVARYGTPRGDDARTKWDGVLIGASAGSQVRAVHGGRVVFADWLRGAGLLVILDHGNGYLSLYGHNQSLLKDAGDVVKAGEPIATVGTTGGQDTPALYFAIRQQGRPSDPAQWCRAQG